MTCGEFTSKHSHLLLQRVCCFAAEGVLSHTEHGVRSLQSILFLWLSRVVQ